MLRLASAGVWVTVGGVLAVLVWAAVDPFGIRQRLDWMVADQFLKTRRAAPVHEHLLQVSIDDHAAEQLGFPVPRYKLARALRQLRQLGARTVLVDVLFSEPHAEPAQDEARRWLVPPKSLFDESLPELAEQFREDDVLARAMSEMESLVVPFHLRPPEPSTAAANELLDRMVVALAATPTMTANELATQLNAPIESVSRAMDRAVDRAMERIVRQAEPGLDANDENGRSSILPGDATDPYLLRSLSKSMDRVRSLRLLEQKATTPGGDGRAAASLIDSDDPKTPRLDFVVAAATLGFMDAALDGDGSLRSLPLVARWNDRLVFHQGLLAATGYWGRRPSELSLTAGELRSGDGAPHIPLDPQGRLAINWPMNRRRDWAAAIPQLSLADVIKLDSFEFDVLLARHELRQAVALMAQFAQDGLGWNTHFQNILSAYEQGRLDDAARLEHEFEPALKQVPELTDVRAAIERADTTPVPAPNHSPDSPLVQWARVYLGLQRQLPELEREHQSIAESLRSRVTGRICLIGDTTTGSVDFKQTPVGGSVPGISVIAAAVNTILTGRHLSAAGFGPSAEIMLLVTASISVVFLRGSARAAGLAAVSAVLALLFGSYLALETASILVSPVTPLVGLIATYSTTTTYRWWHEFQQKKLVRSIFEAHTNPTVVQRLIDAGTAGVEEVLSPRKRQVTVLFAEIVGYNELTENLSGDRVAQILSRVFGSLARIILAHDGTLDKYEGHAMMAFFGAPLYQPDHAERACRAAVESRDAVHELASDESFKELPSLRVHFGIHTGELLVGNITLTSRVDYTVAGENLSVAYRIAELNDSYSTEIMITEATAERCAAAMDARELELVRIKGRREPIRAFELIGPKSGSPTDRQTLLATFLTGLTAFRNRDYAGALSMFRACHTSSPDDGPTVVFMERCQRELQKVTQEHA
jgi:class 3 adenylate cyclase/CHASE2 domain-containing sensor protein